MRSTLSLYHLAEKRNIPIERFPIPETGSLCVRSQLGRYYIGMDPQAIETECDERVHLAHELGHCCTGSLYNRHAACDIRQKHEYRADRWAIKKLIPRDELEKAVAIGYTEPWELAEHFDVTQAFMEKAMEYYQSQERYCSG